MSTSSFVPRLLYMKRNGVELERALDIGAYRGEFTNTLKSVWPNVQVQQFDADDRNKDYLQADAVIGVLGDAEREVDLYTIPDTSWGSTTGTSVFRENTHYYNNPIVIKKQMITLDSVVKMDGDWSKGLMKIDTQGSELLILNGAKQFLALKPRFILLECSYVKYNSGAPLISDVFKYMDKIKYRPKDILNSSYDNGQLIQSDWLFETL